MAAKTNNEKIIFGVKIRFLRQQAGYAFADFSKKTGMSVSYLNEIEKGKKYPKEDKIIMLAQALEVSADMLKSSYLPNQLKPVKELLESNFLNELPLDMFGINLSKVVEIIANSPLKVGAFISTLVEIARNYSFQEENFYFGALRSYLEINNNYFEHFEDSVIAFKKANSLVGPTVSEKQLANILETKYGYTIVYDGLDNHPELAEIRSVYRDKDKTLLLNSELESPQRAFQFAKEIGFIYLSLKERASTASIVSVKSFEQTLSHFGASYFSAALIVSRDDFADDMRALFAKKEWNGDNLRKITKKYNATHEVIIQRMTNILPKFLGLKKIFIQRNFLNHESGKVTIERELHIHEKHRPHYSALGEHYCRRWLSVNMLNRLSDKEGSANSQETIIDAQISDYHNTEDKYLCMSMAKSSKLRPNKKVSITIGIKIEEGIEEEIKFINDPAIKSKTVNITCERCPIEDCTDRVKEPTTILRKQKKKAIQIALDKIMNQ